MEGAYSPGMIWVGKEAEAGAQIAVNEVRGDVVLWLDEPALEATHYVKDGVKRPCGFMALAQVGRRTEWEGGGGRGCAGRGGTAKRGLQQHFRKVRGLCAGWLGGWVGAWMGTCAATERSGYSSQQLGLAGNCNDDGDNPAC